MSGQDSRQAILFIGGGQETIPGIMTAKSMGLSVIVSDIDSNAPSIELADHFLNADTYDANKTIDEVNKFQKDNRPIDGVICLANDVPLTVAMIANEFGLPGIPVESAEIVSDKILMKDLFKEHSLPIPWYEEIYSSEQLKSLAKERGFPLVIKPVDSRGSRGVLLLTKDIDLEWAYSISRDYSPSNRVMVEQFLEGPQVSTESIVIDSNVTTIGFSDRNYENLEKFAPHIVEDGGELPSFLPQEVQSSIKAVVEKTASALNINNGVIKGDMVYSANQPHIIEVAARLSGGYFATHEIPINTGVDFVKVAIQSALGESIPIESIQICQNNPVIQRYFFPKPGRVKEIYIPDWIAKNSNIKLFEIRVSIGDIVPKATHHPSRAGLVITTGSNKSEALRLAKDVVGEVKIITE